MIENGNILARVTDPERVITLGGKAQDTKKRFVIIKKLKLKNNITI